jgi:hypothetical protein
VVVAVTALDHSTVTDTPRTETSHAVAVTCSACHALEPDRLHRLGYLPRSPLVCDDCCPQTHGRWDRIVDCRHCTRRVYYHGGWPHGYCSEPCQKAARRDRERARSRRDRGRRTCGVCAATFTPRRSDARYCSPACRQKAYRQRWSP